jgi:hypothetical protein
MKSKVLTAALMLMLPISAMADRHGHYGGYGGYGGHHHNRGGGNRWIAPAIIGGVIAGTALYGVTRDREVVIERDPNEDYYRRELVRQELREEQLRQRERELERRERQLYGNYYQQRILSQQWRFKLLFAKLLVIFSVRNKPRVFNLIKFVA